MPPAAVFKNLTGLHRQGRDAFRLLAAAALVLLALANCGQAFLFPLELELREGSSWLYVLAQRAGLSIYDHHRVAFVNMNHGPLDPVLKFAIATLLPFLSPAMVTRFFVLVLPFGLFVALTRACRDRLTALLWSLGLYVFLLGLQPPNFLIGRSDATAVFLFALMLGVGATTVDQPGKFWRAFAASLLGALVILTNWRFSPAVAAALAGFGLETVAAAERGVRKQTLFLYLGAVVLGSGLPFLAVLFGIFHGNGPLYYRHFFGFFTGDGGWGTVKADHFLIFPPDLLAGRWLVHLLALGVVILGLVFPAPRISRRMQLFGWIPLLILLWLTCSAAYFLNHSGGGLYYYGAIYVLLTFHLARAVDWSRLRSPWLNELMVAGLLVGLPWGSSYQQTLQLANSFEQAHAFLRTSRDLAAGATIHSEDYHLFKDRYQGEVVDLGDVVAKVSASRYFGDDLTETANRYFAQLSAHPPQFVISGGLGSPALQALLAQSYQPVLRVPYSSPYAGPAQTLYRLKAASPP